MVKNKLFLIFFLIVANPFDLFGQDHRFVLFFTDKENSKFSIENPAEFLSERAIQRRSRQKIEITKEDLPVSTAYLDSLRARNIKYYHQTKWLNGVIIQADSSTLLTLQNAAYIDSIIYIAPGAKLNNPYGFKDASATADEVSTDKLINSNHGIALPQNEMMEVGEMHEQGYLGEGMLVGVFDGGFDNVDEVAGFKHLFDENRIIAAKNFPANNDSVYQYSNHGTHALSCIAGYIPEKFVGTAPNASFVLCVTEDVEGEYRVEEYNWLFAAEFADSLGVDVINTSLGYNTFSDPSMNYNYAQFDGNTTVISRAAAIASRKGMLLVTSAGNEGANAWQYISAPADADSTLAVGAVDINFKKASFSSIGPTADGRLKPEVTAFGTEVVVINRAGNLSTARGTSFAAPLMTGLVAGFWQANPDLSNIEVIDRIKLAGHKAAAPGNELGFGVPSFTRAMNQEILGTSSPDADPLMLYPNPIINGRLYIQLKEGNPEKDMEIFIYNSTGAIVKQNKIPFASSIPDPYVLDFSDVAPGVYIINIVSQSTSEASKVINF